MIPMNKEGGRMYLYIHGSLISGWCPRMGGQLGVDVRVEV
jgi:hypothetical protein